jgi:hypothetical protein
MQLSASTAVKFVVQGDGKVGIGTDSPTYQLVVDNQAGNDAAYIQIKTDNDQSGYLFFGDGDHNYPASIGYNHSTHKMSFSAGSDDIAMTILGHASDNSTKVGIGTTSPGYSLDATSSQAGNWHSNIENTASDGYGLRIKTASTSGSQVGFGYYAGNDLHFRIMTDGKVGIGGSPTTGCTVATSANISQVAITSSSNAVAWDAAAAANAYHLTTENTTFSEPTNGVEGAIISVEIAQGGTARTIAWHGDYEFAASTAPTITATANKTDILTFRFNGLVWQEIGRVQNLAQT